MLVLVTYDVNTETPEGRKRLRKIAKVCNDYGIRVQNSVFECVVNSAEFFTLRVRIDEIINPELDSVRYYNLGNHGRYRVIHIGKRTGVDVEAPLVF